jgi:hypothetical protein
MSKENTDGKIRTHIWLVPVPFLINTITHLLFVWQSNTILNKERSTGLNMEAETVRFLYLFFACSVNLKSKKRQFVFDQPPHNLLLYLIVFLMIYYQCLQGKVYVMNRF